MVVYKGKPIMVAVVLMGMLLLSSVMAFGDTFLEDYLNRGPCYQHKSNCEGYGLKSCRYKCQCEGYAGGKCVHVGVQTCMSFTPYHCVCHGHKIKLLPRLCRL